MISMFRIGDIPVSPSDVKWSSSNIKVATVDKKGNVRAAAPGTAKISAEFSEKTAPGQQWNTGVVLFQRGIRWNKRCADD